MGFEIDYEASAVKALSRIDRSDAQRIVTKVAALADDPRPAGSTKLAGTDTGWRIRIGNYRVVYSIDDQAQIVTVTRIGHRRDVYRRM